MRQPANGYVNRAISFQGDIKRDAFSLRATPFLVRLERKVDNSCRIMLSKLLLHLELTKATMMIFFVYLLQFKEILDGLI